MPALLINIKIDSREKCDIFKVTLADMAGLFEECHIKIRGSFSQECVEYAQRQTGAGVHFYQELQEKDWVAATLEMVSQVKCRSIFLYVEDHKLVAGRQRLERTLADFDSCELDYLCYSFFRASQLDANNLLPLDVTTRELFQEFALTSQNLGLIGKISPTYVTFSLVSAVSVKYFKHLLTTENKAHKIFCKTLISGIVRLFPHPHYRRFIKTVNGTLSWFDARLCISPPSSPFNLEKIWFETGLPLGGGWKFGIPKEELFANYDDDNGAYGESLIKRGLYPFNPHSFDTEGAKKFKNIVRRIDLAPGEFVNCTYYSHNGRIGRAPEIEINVVRGNVAVLYQGNSYPISSGGAKWFYSNLGPVIQSIESSELKLTIFDQAF